MAWLHECMTEKGFGKKATAKFFTAKALHLNGDGVTDYFVRPALRPYCQAFYGAHLFRYWFIIGHRMQGKTTYKIVFKNGGDEARILANVTNGYHDLALIGHTAAEAYTTTWRFNGKHYAQAGCIRQVMGDNGWTGDSPCPAIDDSSDSDEVTATPPDPSPPRSSTSPPSPLPAAGG
ncbi:hypothetical protein GJ700_15510 [Duganella sp. FT92W]|uniref:Uncharacterized protein n=1 Tax=Pseudoduganella rivuli TaxID=2666085 RepID=A0A7X2IN64_9BURK|nr:hypothetical protein [Pseudoduganella rivuli]MRV73116.1 hypothetical protein [Pseudoduganella rivuli]